MCLWLQITASLNLIYVVIYAYKFSIEKGTTHMYCLLEK